MTKIRIKIELLSDLCCYSGEVYNTTVDTDVVYDSYGIPYIPAKRIKGCIREAALELKELGIISEYDSIFGKEGNDESLFTLSNAKIDNYEEVVTDIKAFAKKHADIVEPQKVLQQYTYVRTQTAVDSETGSANENSLRTMRVVKKGQVFYADCEFKGNEKQLAEFKDAVRIVKHMGVSRTRGLGLVNLKIEATNNDTIKHVRFKKDDLFDNNEIEYTIQLESPVICKSSEGNQAKSEDYISGSKILGVIAGSMSKDSYRRSIMNDIIVSNAYIASNNKRTNPGRNSWQKNKKEKYKIKDDKYKEKGNDGEIVPEMDLTDMMYYENSGETVQYSPANIKYISEDGFVKSVETEISYHHQRPEDKSIGRATESNGAFYQLGSICEGQVFKGYIRAKKNVAEMLCDSIEKLGSVRIGYGKNSEFGRVSFSLDSVKEIKEEPKLVKQADLLLVSDLILYNDNGMLVSDIETLEKYLKDYFKCDDIKIDKPYLSYSTIGGFNVTCRSRKPIFTALSKGSVMRVTSNKGFNASYKHHYFIGERNSEGYGEFVLEAVLEKPKDEKDEKNLTKTVKKAKEHNDFNEKEFEEIQANSIIRDLLEKECLKQVDGIIREKVNGLGKVDTPALSKIRLLFRTKDKFSDMYEECNLLNKNKEECLKLLGEVPVKCDEFPNDDLLDIKAKEIKDKYWGKFKLNWNEEKKYQYLYNAYITELKNVKKKGEAK